MPGGGATALSLFKVTKGSTGPVVQTTGTNVAVPAYSVPADVPQPGTGDKLDSSDTRPTQAVSAIDPLRGNKVGLWTQHTVLGGAGAAVRWYEIDPATATVLQSETISSPTKYVFNGAVSPDRLVKGTTKKFGSNLLATFNQGSSADRVGVYVASKKGTADLSAPVLLKLSATTDRGFGSGCSGQCRWGDYAARDPRPRRLPHRRDRRRVDHHDVQRPAEVVLVQLGDLERRLPALVGAQDTRSASTGASARNACPRWLIASFSSAASSAVVRDRPSGTSSGS